ncbi:MAG: VOC family protein [Actinomycetota bacterium]
MSDRGEGRGRVTGIGGVFFRSPDPAATRRWYAEHLGLGVDEYGSSFTWRSDTDPSERGHTLWSPFDADTDYFGDDEQQAMINYRVDDLDAVLSRLRSGGVTLVGDTQVESYGRFQHVIDGDGRRIELWEPITSEYENIADGVTSS